MIIIVGVGDVEEDGEDGDDENDMVTWMWSLEFGVLVKNNN